MFFNLYIYSSCGHFIHRSETVLAISKESHLSNNCIKTESNRPKGIEGIGV